MKRSRLVRLVPSVLVLTFSFACVAQENVWDKYQDQAETHELAAYNAFQNGWTYLLRRTPEDAGGRSRDDCIL